MKKLAKILLAIPSYPGISENPTRVKPFFFGGIGKKYTYLVLAVLVFFLQLFFALSVMAQCATPNSTQFPAAAVNAGTGALIVISNTSQEGQYSRITGIVNGARYLFSIGQTGDIVTVRSGSFNGAIIGAGSPSVTVTATSTADLYIHWNTSTCGNGTTNRTTGMQGIPTITSLGSSNGCAGSSIVINGTNLSGVSAANVTIGGTAVTAITSNTATQIIATIGTGNTGTVAVSNNSGSGISAATFTVNPIPTNISPAPVAYNVCYGSGTNIQIPASQSGVNYQLRNNASNINVGTAVAGNGGTINLPTGDLTAATTFNVLATNATTGCFRQLTPTITISIDNVAPVITCPSNITTNAGAGLCGAIVSYTVTATDNCQSTNCVPASMNNYTFVANYGGHSYYRSNFSVNWATAKANAIALGGHLLTLSSAGENNLFTGLGSLWAGFTDEAVEGTWVWVTGEPVVFTSWAGGEPNDYNANEDHMQLNWSANNWNDNLGTNNYPYVVEFDCQNLNINLVSGFASGSIFPVGTTTVTYNSTDAAGNTSSNCSFTVTVNDVTAPTIVCPSNITINAAAGACDAVVNYNLPVASDNCGTCTSSPVISGYTSLGLYNGAAYYISNSLFTATAAFSTAVTLGGSVSSVSSVAENTFIRNAANSAGFTGTYLIGVNDVNVEGTFTGFFGETLSYTNWSAGEPNNSGGNEDYAQVLNSAAWNDVGGTSTSNYILKISCITPVRTAGLASGSSFPIGTSSISYAATDPSGNVANCSFTVTVAINPSSLSKTVTAAATPVCINTGTTINVGASDNGISYQLRNNSNNANVGSPVVGNGGTISLPTGNLTATTTYNVLGTGSSCSFQLTNTVTVVVNAAATVVGGSTVTVCQSATPVAITLSGASVGGSATTAAWSITSGGGTLSSTAQTGTPASVTYTPAANYSGTVTLTLTSNDPAGPCGAVAATRTIVVNALPINRTPTAVAATICAGTGTSIQIATSESGVNYQLRNNAGNVNVGAVVAGTGGTINLPTGNLTATTTFNVLATNATTACFLQMTTNVTISMDNIAPTISCPATQQLNLGASCSATLPNYTSLAVVSDNCTATASIVITQSPVAGTTLSAAGTQLITLTATDASGNFSTCTFNVTKRDVTAPTINCQANITTNASSSLCGAIVNYTVTASDNCASCAPTTVTGYTLIGNYNGHTYFRSNTSSLWPVARTNAQNAGAHLVTISSAGENAFLGGLGVHWGGMTDEVTEGTWLWVTGEPVIYTSWTPGEPNNGGTQQYLALNYSGINWDDQGTPTTGTLPSIIEFDCLNTNLVSGFASGSIFPVGTTTVTYNSTDAAGNTSSNCSFTVTVNDVTAPTIVCPSNITINAAAGACDAVVNYNLPVASDNCGTCTSSPVISGYTSLGLYNGAAYYISNSLFTATAAFSTAVTLGGSVSSVSSVAENTFIRNAANSAGFTGTYLIGVNDVNVEGTFTGFFGETLSYTNWSAGEPNNSGGNEDYAQVLNSAAWNDVGGTSTSNYILKISCITPVRTAGLASGSSFPIGTSSISYAATDPSGNVANCSFTVTVAINPSSLSKTVTAAATPVCINTGTTINVGASDNGISYQLRNNSNNANVGSPVVGNGGTISLPTGNLTATTTYNVLGTGSSCSFQLTNTVTVVVNAAATVVGGSTVTVCQSATPVAITLSGASVGGSATTAAWSITSGGGTLSSTAQTGTPASVTYTPAANYSGTVTLTLTSNDPAGPCGAVAATRTIVVNALPINRTPTAVAATICAGTGTSIQIATSESGVNYQLRNNAGNVNVGAVVAGTGGTINLPTGNLTATTTFNVLATNATTACFLQMTTTVTVTINALPTDRTPTAVSSAVCTGTATDIQIATSQTGVNYQLRNNTGNVNIGAAVAGTGGTIVLPTGTITSNMTFNVLATITSTGCSVQMINPVAVSVNATGQWVGSSSGNWNTASNWCGGVPTSSSNVNIPAGTTVTIQSANAVANSVTIAGTASLIMTGAHNLNISAGGSFTNNGTFTATASSGVVAFLGNGTVNGSTTFNNIDTYGALNFGTASTIAGTFSIQTGGSVIGNSPTYTCPTAVLLYKPGSTFARGLEWTNNSSGAGYPANVVVQNNTTINFPAVGDGFICYDLAIENGSSLLQDYSGGSANLRVGRNVTISGTLSLGSNNGGDIYVGGNWIRNTGATFNANDRKVTFDGPANFSGNGSTMSTITAPASASKDNEGGFGGEKFAHIWINKSTNTDSVVLLSNITVTRELGLTRGTFSLRNSDVTLVSNKTRTADIAPITSVSNVTLRYGGTGNFVVQRFIQNPTSVRSWRLLTAPLQHATAPTLNAAYQEGVVNPDRANPNANGGMYNPWPGYGTHITGPGGVYSALNGFDHGTNTASILYSNPGVTTWTNPATTTTTKVTDRQGWMLFVRGDRSFAIGNQYIAAQNTTLEPKGRINIGDVVVPVVAAKQVIANPYASAISLLEVDVAGTTGKNSTYYMWDPKMFTSYTQPGKWVTFTGTGNSFVQTTSESAYASNGIIESGQAFVVDATSAGNITFKESDKLPLTSSLIGIANGNSARPAATMPMFRSDIYANNNGVYALTDAVLNLFNEAYSNVTNTEDAKKVITFNTKESLSILRDSIKLAIEKRRDVQDNDTIFFSMSRFNEIPYRFRFNASSFAPGMEAFLEDKFTNTRTPLSTSDTTIVDFAITSNPLSKVEDRFRVVFKVPFRNVLPVTFTNIKAYTQNKNIAVEWNVQNELNIQRYDVEKSHDGLHFEKVHATPSQGNYTNGRTYKWLDENAVIGKNYYRIQSYGLDNTTQYSQVVVVNMLTIKGSVSVYPNPITDGIIRLSFDGMEKGNYFILLLNVAGQTVLTTNINHAGATSTIKQISISKSIAKGIYNMEVTNAAKEKISIKIIVE